jgi:hypothetical protein
MKRDRKIDPMTTYGELMWDNCISILCYALRKNKSTRWNKRMMGKFVSRINYCSLREYYMNFY